jgi:predicted MFS family arabinose efflux permease
MTGDAAERGRALRRMLWLLGLFFVLVQVNRSGGAVLATYLADRRGLSPADIGAVMGAMFLASALAQLPTGILFDWIGPRRTLAWLGMVAVAGLAVFALAGEHWGMMAGRFAIGIGHGGVITAVYLVAMAWAPPARTAQATAAVIGIAGGIGGVLATIPLAFALDRFGLQASFLALAVGTGVLTLVLGATLRDRPPDAPDAPPQPRETLGETVAGLMRVVRMRELRRIFAMGLCFTAPFMTIGGLWAGPYFIDVHHVGRETAALLVLGLVVALHVGTFAYGPLERRTGSRRNLILAGVAVEIAALAVLAAWPAAPLALSYPLLFVFGCAAPFFVVLAAHVRSFVPARRAGRAITCINLVGLTGVFVMQSGTGALIHMVERGGGAPETGYRLVFLAVIAILAASGLIYSRQPERPSAPPE